MRRILASQRGSTFIEMLFYVVFSSLVLTAVISLSFDISAQKTRSHGRMETRESSRIALLKVMESIRSASAVISDQSVWNVHPGKLVLQRSDGQNVTFEIAASRVSMKVGGGDALFLTPGDMMVANLVFRHLVKDNERSSVFLDLTLSRVNNTGSPDWDAQTRLHGSASLR